MNKPKKPFDKARAYHRRWCVKADREMYDETITVWHFALAPKFMEYTEMVEIKK